MVHRKHKGKRAIDHKYRREEDEQVKSDKIVFANTFRSPRTVMVVSLDADIAVYAMEGTTGHVKSTLSAET
jgi:hypothetical protein